MTTFFVEGLPAPQGSKKYVGNGRMIESSKHLPAWRDAVKEAAQQHAETPIDQPVTVMVDFFMPKPKKPMFDYPATAPDCDKLQRAIGDGLEQGGLLRNDARIVKWVACEWWAEPDEPTGALITVTPRTLAKRTNLNEIIDDLDRKKNQP